jgi:hypothetical protein
MDTSSKRTRLTVDLPAEVKQRLRLVTTLQNISIRQYVLIALEERLGQAG